MSQGKRVSRLRPFQEVAAALRSKPSSTFCKRVGQGEQKVGEQGVGERRQLKERKATLRPWAWVEGARPGNGQLAWGKGNSTLCRWMAWNSRAAHTSERAQLASLPAAPRSSAAQRCTVAQHPQRCPLACLCVKAHHNLHLALLAAAAPHEIQHLPHAACGERRARWGRQMARAHAAAHAECVAGLQGAERACYEGWAARCLPGRPPRAAGSGAELACTTPFTPGG